MEPVPETESLESFHSPPVPTLRLQQPRALSAQDLDFYRKPAAVRRSTEPLSPSSPSWTSPPALALPFRPRTTSPLSGHTRSKSTSLAPPSMSRTKSMPGIDVAGRVLSSPLFRPASPSGSPSRSRSLRKPVDESFPPLSPIRSSVLESDKKASDGLGTAFGHHRRTSSPLRHVIPPAAQSVSPLPSTPSSLATSPSYRYELGATGYNFPSYHPSSSVPSTPTSIRSRSPSISSLETIPDSPDAEEAALEDERIAKLKAAAEGSDGEESGGRSSLDVPSRGRTLGLGSRDKRKRWSVCGAERRGDIDLETIWED
ncbi:hypothetical protein BX600DRAFT_508451 [Xylariales sp. PMI_506]|nr:hypothetical protein BX600DRAFT_508451 [Xylariales sp. PMI_506]